MIDGIDLDKLDKCQLVSLVRQLAAENDRLEFFIKQMQRAQFGRRSEKLDPDQYQLALEDAEQSAAAGQAGVEQVEARQPASQRPPRPRREYNRGALPESLPHEDVFIEPEDKTCPCCGSELHVIADETSQMLDIVPAQFKVIVVHRPKYGCRTCEGAVVQAPAPARPIDGGMATEALIAFVIVSKYLDAVPLYRQAQIYARQGIKLDRSTLCEWVGRACWWFKPLHDHLLEHLLSSTRIFADDTPVPVLDPGRGKTKTGRLWAYARDDRPWQGQAPPAVAYVYSEDRKAEHPIAHLATFKGVLQVDAYVAFDNLVRARKDDSVILAHCWAHWRRRLYEIHQANGSPLAAEALRRIAALYAIEDEIRGASAAHRQAVRAVRSRPLVDDLKAWLEAQIPTLSGKSPLAEAIRYGLTRWKSFCVFLDDGRVEMDNNTVERTIRPVAMTRKAALFAGSDGGAENWAILGSLIQSAKLNGVEPFAYLRDTLVRLVAGHPINRLEELMPWNYAASKAPGAAPS